MRNETPRDNRSLAKTHILRLHLDEEFGKRQLEFRVAAKTAQHLTFFRINVCCGFWLSDGVIVRLARTDNCHRKSIDHCVSFAAFRWTDSLVSCVFTVLPPFRMHTFQPIQITTWPNARSLNIDSYAVGLEFRSRFITPYWRFTVFFLRPILRNGDLGGRRWPIDRRHKSP